MFNIYLIVDSFIESGLHVWVDEIGLEAGSEFLNKIGQAIVDAKVSYSGINDETYTFRYETTQFYKNIRNLINYISISCLTHSFQITSKYSINKLRVCNMKFIKSSNTNK